jgi:osmotically inducible protein OsmC
MPEQTRRADVVWNGDLLSGSGTITRVTSGAISEQPVTWASRTEEASGRTSPEELLAAAHASCFSMQLSSFLAKAGHRPERLDVSAEVVFRKLEAWKVAESRITVRGQVPGISEDEFRKHADAAKEGCPISGALKGNVELSVDAALVREPTAA